MNRSQCAKQLQFLLQNANWPGGGYQIFAPGSVAITSEPPSNALAEMRPPCAIVQPTSGAADKANPQILTARFNVVLVAAVGGSRLHGTALEGGVRTQGQLGSHGRGLLELEEVLAQAIDDLGDDAGVRLTMRRTGDEAPVVESDVVIAMRAAYRIEGWCVRDRFYAPLRDLVATPLGGGLVQLTWLNPSARWDWRRPVIRWAPGQPASFTPTSNTDASPAPVNSPTQRSASKATSAFVTTGAGVVTFAGFAAYDETLSNADERFSTQDPGTTATVTAT